MECPFQRPRARSAQASKRHGPTFPTLHVTLCKQAPTTSVMVFPRPGTQGATLHLTGRGGFRRLPDPGPGESHNHPVPCPEGFRLHAWACSAAPYARAERPRGVTDPWPGPRWLRPTICLTSLPARRPAVPQMGCTRRPRRLLEAPRAPGHALSGHHPWSEATAWECPCHLPP